MFDKLVALILAGTLSASVAAAGTLALDRANDLARILYDPLLLSALLLDWSLCLVGP